MDVNPIKIKDFTLVPIACGSDMDGLFSEKNESLLGRLKHTISLKGCWPPSPKEIKRLEELVDIIEHVEKKSGVEFSRDVILVGGNKGHFMVNLNHNIQMISQ